MIGRVSDEATKRNQSAPCMSDHMLERGAMLIEPDRSTKIAKAVWCKGRRTRVRRQAGLPPKVEDREAFHRLLR